MTPRETVLQHYADCPTCDAGEWCAIADGLEAIEVEAARRAAVTAAPAPVEAPAQGDDHVVVMPDAPPGPFIACVVGDPWCPCDRSAPAHERGAL
jgi:hypothetical protein